MRDRINHASDLVKKEIKAYPVEAVALAVGAGYYLRSVPVTSVLGTAAKFLTGFGPPTLIALGLVKLAQRAREWERERSGRPW